MTEQCLGIEFHSDGRAIEAGVQNIFIVYNKKITAYSIQDSTITFEIKYIHENRIEWKTYKITKLTESEMNLTIINDSIKKR